MGFKAWGLILLTVSFVPLGFLTYTLYHLSALQISVFHPRVLVEGGLFLLFFFLALFLLARS